MRTFAVQLRVLARIKNHDVKNPVGARFWPGNLLIVPFSLNSPDFKRTGIIVSYSNRPIMTPFGKRSLIYKVTPFSHLYSREGDFLRRCPLVDRRIRGYMRAGGIPIRNRKRKRISTYYRRRIARSFDKNKPHTRNATPVNSATCRLPSFTIMRYVSQFPLSATRRATATSFPVAGVM